MAFLNQRDFHLEFPPRAGTLTKDAHSEAVEGIILGQGRASSLLDLVVKQQDARPCPRFSGFAEVSLGLGDRTL